MRFRLFAPLLAAFASCAQVEVDSSYTASHADREAILGVIQTTFDAIATADRAVWESTLLEEGTFTSIRGEAGSRSIGYTSFEANLARQDGQDRGYLERMWDQVVLVDGDIAMVWTPYDFHINGEFSHAGIDAVVLVRTDNGWKIATIVWSVEPEQRKGAPELVAAPAAPQHTEVFLAIAQHGQPAEVRLRVEQHPPYQLTTRDAVAAVIAERGSRTVKLRHGDSLPTAELNEFSAWLRSLGVEQIEYVIAPPPPTNPAPRG